MVFANFSRIEKNNQIFFKNSSPITNIKNIKFYDDDSKGAFTKQEFKWSFNNSYWSSWSILNQGNISTISMNSNTTLFMEVRYSYVNASASVSKFSINYNTISGVNQNSNCVVTKNNTKIVGKIAKKPSTTSGSKNKEVYYTDFKRTDISNVITFTSINPLTNAKRLLYYKDDSSGGFIKKEFKWSYDNNYWSAWTVLNQGNVTSIDTKNLINMFISVRYVKIGTSGNVNNFGIGYIQSFSNTSQTPCKPPLIKIPIPTPSCEIPTPVYEPNTPAPINKPSIINADTLNNKTGDFYLWRPNHKGQQPISTITDLSDILEDLRNNTGGISDAYNVDGDGIGVYYNNEDNKIYFKTLIEGDKVLISENESGNITINMDDASINDLYSLIGSVEGINIGSSTGNFGEIYKQKTGELLEFRTIVGGNSNVNVTTTDNQVVISLDASASGAPIWTDPDPVSADVGGVSGGDTIPLDNNSIEILEQILYEYFPPTISELSPESGYFEKYVDEFDVSINGSFDTNNSPKTIVDSAELLINGMSSISYPPIIYPPNTKSGTFEWDVTGDPFYSDRTYTVKIQNHYSVNTNIMPSSDASLFINYVNPYFYGVVGDEVTVDNITSNDIINLSKLIVPEQTNLIDYDVSANYKKIKFIYAYDASYDNINLIFDVKNNFNVTTSFDTGTILINNGSAIDIPYKFFIKNHWISFTPDVSIFKLKFDI